MPLAARRHGRIVAAVVTVVVARGMNRRPGRREDRRERWQREPGGAAREAGSSPWAGGDGDRCLAGHRRDARGDARAAAARRPRTGEKAVQRRLVRRRIVHHVLGWLDRDRRGCGIAMIDPGSPGRRRALATATAPTAEADSATTEALGPTASSRLLPLIA